MTLFLLLVDTIEHELGLLLSTQNCHPFPADGTYLSLFMCTLLLLLLL